MNERQPLKFQEVMKPDFTPPGSTRRVQEAYERLFSRQETLADRYAIERHAYCARYGIEELEDPEPTLSENQQFRSIVSSEMDPKKYFKRQVRLYKRFIRRVFRWQAEINASQAGEVTILKFNSRGDPQETIINQDTVNNLLNMAGRIRENLYDGGYQSAVNKIHGDLGITITEDGKLTKEVIFERERGDIYYEL